MQLGQISLRPRPPKERSGGLSGPRPAPTPVTLLQYDAYSSFAPIYDSTGAQLSYQESIRLRDARIKLREHEKKDLYAIQDELQQASQQETSSKIELDDEDLQLLNMSREEYSDFFGSLATTSQASQNLEYHASIIKSLQTAQWDRLRKGMQATQQSNFGSSAPAPGLGERSDAESLLNSMVDMVAESLTPRQLIRSLPALRHSLASASFAATKEEDEAPASYPGLLAHSNAVAVRESVLTKLSSDPTVRNNKSKKTRKTKRTSYGRGESPEDVYKPPAHVASAIRSAAPRISLDSLAAKEETRLARHG